MICSSLFFTGNRKELRVTLGTTAALAGAVAGAAILTWILVRLGSSRASNQAARLHEQKISDLISKGRAEEAASMLVADSKFKEAMDLLMSAKAFGAAGKVALKLRDYRKAASLFQKTGDIEAAVNALLKIKDFRSAGEILSGAGQHEKAAQLYKQAGSLDLAAEEFVQAGDFKNAADIYAGIGDQSRARMYFAIGLRKEGKLLEAAQAFGAANLHLDAAECLREAARPAEAALEYQRAGKPEVGAKLLEKLGKITEAASMYVEAGDHEAAARLYQVVRNPTMEMEALVSGRKLLEAGHMAYKAGNLKKAEQILKMATPGDRGYDRVCMLLGKILEDDGRMKEAISYYAVYAERSIATPQNQQAFNYLYDLFIKENRTESILNVLKALERADLLTPEQRQTKAVMDKEHNRLKQESQEIAVGQEQDNPELPRGIPDRYKVQERLGKGGTAVVYKARDEKLQRDVVLKILSNSSLPPELAQEYFLREAQIVAGISHPRIVKVFDMGIASGRHYMILEFVDGVTLEEYLSGLPNKTMSLKEISVLAKQLADALGFAHSHKIIHRDVKPTNIMVLRDGTMKLMDFGMAKALEVHRDQSQYICGTPDYMSPEQEAGYDLTSATDVYSFALVLSECLLGSLPLGNSGPSTRTMREEFITRGNLPPEITAMLLSALNHDPDLRPDVAKLASVF